MAKFIPPFSTDGENRLPTSDEQAQGFACGPADRQLFGGLFRRIEAELRAIQDAGGIAGNDNDDTTVLRAIQALISAATGGGDTSQFVLLSQATARLPIFPDVQSVTGHFGVTSPSTGQVRLPAGVSFLHRGISPYVTAQVDLSTDASKTYHLRWNRTDGFTLKDLALGTYNPSTLAEADARFDSTYDDMLVARVITNSSNVPTITNLVNRAHLKDSGYISGVAGFYGGGDRTIFTGTFNLNWARTPVCMFAGTNLISGSGGYRIEGTINYITEQSVTRYVQTANVRADFVEVIPVTPYGDLRMLAVA